MLTDFQNSFAAIHWEIYLR